MIKNKFFLYSALVLAINGNIFANTPSSINDSSSWTLEISNGINPAITLQLCDISQSKSSCVTVPSGTNSFILSVNNKYSIQGNDPVAGTISYASIDQDNSSTNLTEAVMNYSSIAWAKYVMVSYESIPDDAGYGSYYSVMDSPQHVHATGQCQAVDSTVSCPINNTVNLPNTTVHIVMTGGGQPAANYALFPTYVPGQAYPVQQTTSNLSIYPAVNYKNTDYVSCIDVATSTPSPGDAGSSWAPYDASNTCGGPLPLMDLQIPVWSANATYSPQPDSGSKNQLYPVVTYNNQIYVGCYWSQGTPPKFVPIAGDAWRIYNPNYNPCT